MCWGCVKNNQRQTSKTIDERKRNVDGKRTSLEVLPRLPRDLVVVPRKLLVEHAILLVDPGNVALVLVLALTGTLLTLVETALVED